MTNRMILNGLMILALTMGCASTGARIDNLCIAGQIRSESATWLNEHPDTWKQHRAKDGDAGYEQPIKSGDRLLNGDCSEFLKALGVQDWEGATEAVERVSEEGG